MSCRFFNKKSNQQGGFSLLEMIVVISIFLIITVVVIADIPNFRKKSTLELISSEVATYIRGAQVYGASQKGANTDIRYGIRFNPSATDPLNRFYLFQDNVDSRQESYDIKGFKIGNIIVKDGNGFSLSSVNNIDIVFSTNNYASTIGTKLEPEIYQDYPNSIIPNFSTVDIKIVSDSDNSLYRCVRVYNNGQIAIVGGSNPNGNCE